MTLIETAAAVIGSGGLGWLINWRANRKSQKLEYTEKAVNFMSEQNDRLMKRVEKLEADVAKLMDFKCEKIDCPNRRPPKA